MLTVTLTSLRRASTSFFRHVGKLSTRPRDRSAGHLLRGAALPRESPRLARGIVRLPIYLPRPISSGNPPGLPGGWFGGPLLRGAALLRESPRLARGMVRRAVYFPAALSRESPRLARGIVRLGIYLPPTLPAPLRGCTLRDPSHDSHNRGERRTGGSPAKKMRPVCPVGLRITMRLAEGSAAGGVGRTRGTGRILKVPYGAGEVMETVSDMIRRKCGHPP
jgi:hypothetical protein